MNKHIPLTRIFISAVAIFEAVVPSVAQANINTSIIGSYVTSFLSIINTIVLPIIISVSFITFVWGVYNYFIAGGANPEKRREGTKFLMYGIVGLAIIFSVWGLVAVFSSVFNLTGYSAPVYPTL